MIPHKEYYLLFISLFHVIQLFIYSYINELWKRFKVLSQDNSFWGNDLSDYNRIKKGFILFMRTLVFSEKFLFR